MVVSFLEDLGKHIVFRIEHANKIKTLSPCPRGQVGAVIFNPETFTIISDGYNGPPRKGGHLCGDTTCTRDDLSVLSGTRGEVGCHHAEVNAICNAARSGHTTAGMHMAVSCSPCLMCAKMIHHAGITQVYFQESNYTSDGIEYLDQHIHLVMVRS